MIKFLNHLKFNSNFKFKNFKFEDVELAGIAPASIIDNLK